ncbi:hypothetical protein KC342_g15 [Hortaea werneckii]|nr:hypothetical protein KC342_g15 [Hortaea werneckii]
MRSSTLFLLSGLITGPSAQGHATLSRSTESRACDAVNCVLLVGVWKEGGVVLRAKVRLHSLPIVRAALVDVFSDTDEVYGFGPSFGNNHRRTRIPFRRLDDNGIAGDSCNWNRPQRDHSGEQPPEPRQELAWTSPLASAKVLPCSRTMFAASLSMFSRIRALSSPPKIDEFVVKEVCHVLGVGNGIVGALVPQIDVGADEVKRWIGCWRRKVAVRDLAVRHRKHATPTVSIVCGTFAAMRFSKLKPPTPDVTPDRPVRHHITPSRHPTSIPFCAYIYHQVHLFIAILRQNAQRTISVCLPAIPLLENNQRTSSKGNKNISQPDLLHYSSSSTSQPSVSSN